MNSISKKKKLMRLKILLFLLLVLLISGVYYHHLAQILPSQMAAERWRGQNNTDFLQYSVFFPADKRLEKMEIEEQREAIQRLLLETVMIDDRNKRQWIDAYSSESKVMATSEHGSVSLQAFGIGGDYFFFHPLLLVDGVFIGDGDISKHRVVLDDTAAWGLFGSSNVMGMEVKINDQLFVVAGVVHNDSNVFTNRTKSDSGSIYLHYSIFNALCDVGINSYEVILPELVSGYSNSVLARVFSPESGEIVQNSNRFHLSTISKRAFTTSAMIIQQRGIAWPYFENAARLIEYRLVHIFWFMLLLLFILFIILLPSARSVYLIIKWRVFRTIKKLNVSK